MKSALFSLAAAAFGIGTTEFVIMGLLPDVARDLHVSIPTAGALITGYALSVAFGAPLMAFATGKLPRRLALLLLMGIFILGNVLCAIAPNYWMLMLARVITALCHGAFFGIGSVTAASLVPDARKASAVAMMFMGLTVANVVGVPFGTAIGQALGWRTTFWIVAGIGILALASLYLLLPKQAQAEQSRDNLSALKSVRVWIAMLITVAMSASMFALFTYIAPVLEQVTGITPHGVTLTLLSIGVGLTLGNFVGGKLADWRLNAALLIVPAVVALIQLAFYPASRSLVAAEIVLFLWGAGAFAAVAILQINAINQGKDASGLISTLNIGAFNTGNALGAWVGGLVIAGGMGLQSVTLAAAGLAVAALIIALVMVRLNAAPHPVAAKA